MGATHPPIPADPAPRPFLTIEVWEGLPHVQVTFDPAYAARGGETDLLLRIGAAVREWRKENDVCTQATT